MRVNRTAVNVSGEWQAAENNTWRFQKSDGSYAKNEWARINDKWYHLTAAAICRRAGFWMETSGIN